MPQIAKRGSFLFPHRADFTGDVREYADFFLTADIDDAVLSSVASTYQATYDEALIVAERRGRRACDEDPEMRAWAKSIGGVFQKDQRGLPIKEHGRMLERPEWVERENQWAQRYREEEAAKWPRPRIAAFDVRTIAAVGQAMHMRRILVTDDRKEQLAELALEVEVDGDPKTFGECYDLYHMNSWFRKAMP